MHHSIVSGTAWIVHDNPSFWSWLLSCQQLHCKRSLDSHCIYCQKEGIKTVLDENPSDYLCLCWQTRHKRTEGLDTWILADNFLGIVPRLELQLKSCDTNRLIFWHNLDALEGSIGISGPQDSLLVISTNMFWEHNNNKYTFTLNNDINRYNTNLSKKLFTYLFSHKLYHLCSIYIGNTILLLLLKPSIEHSRYHCTLNKRAKETAIYRSWRRKD